MHLTQDEYNLRCADGSLQELIEAEHVVWTPFGVLLSADFMSVYSDFQTQVPECEQDMLKNPERFRRSIEYHLNQHERLVQYYQSAGDNKMVKLLTDKN